MIEDKQQLINKYTKRIEIDYPEADKIAINLEQFAQEIIKLFTTEPIEFANWIRNNTIADGAPKLYLRFPEQYSLGRLRFTIEELYEIFIKFK